METSSTEELPTDDDVTNTLYKFIKNVISEMESRMLVKWKLIFGEEKNVGKRTKVVSEILGALGSAVPIVGKALGGGIKKSVDSGGEYIQKRKALKLEELVFKFNNDKEKFRKDLVNFTAQIFFSYEYQFMSLKTENRDVMIVNLAKDIVHRILNYSRNNQTSEFAIDSIVKPSSLLSDHSIHIPSGSSIKYYYNDKNGECTSSEFFENICVNLKTDEKSAICYSAILKEPLNIGYRRLFPKEDNKIIINEYVIGKRTERIFSLQSYKGDDWDFYEKLTETLLEKLKFDYTELDEKRNLEIFTEIKQEADEILDFLKENKETNININEHIEYMRSIKIEDCMQSLQQHFEFGKNVVLETLTDIKNTNKNHFEEITSLVKQIDLKISGEYFSKKKNVEFGIIEPVVNFTGREKEIKLINKIFQDNSSKKQLSNALTITGLGGVGKSELVRAYINEYRNFYENVIFINAEKQELIVDSFRNLAEILRIPIYVTHVDIKKSTKNHFFIMEERKEKSNCTKLKERDISSIVQDIFEYFLNNGKTLFIYDNAEQYGNIENYLPFNYRNTKDTYVLITSRHQDWNTSQAGEIKLATLDVFNESEAIDFIKKILISDGENDHLISDLTRKLQYLPLILNQAVKTINQKIIMAQKMKKDIYKIINYIDNFEKDSSEFLNSGVSEADRYKNTAMTTWNITMQAIRDDEEDGDFAIKIFNMMAYLSPDNINIKKLFSRFDSEKIEKAITLLENYSMVTFRNGTVSIHRIVQEVTRVNLRKASVEEDIIREVLWLLYSSNFEEHAMVAWEHASRYGYLVKAFYSKSEYGTSKNKAIHLLAKYRNNQEILLNILKYKNSGILQEKNVWGENVLHIAASNHNNKMAEFIVNMNRNLVYSRNWEGETPMILAVKKKYFDIVKIFDFENEIYSSLTYFYNVIEKNDIDAFCELIVKVNWTTKTTLLETIWRLIFEKKCKEDMNKMADIFLKHFKYIPRKKILLKEMIEERNMDAILFILNNELDINALFDNKFTPLCYAAWKGHENMVALILSKGANAKFKNKYGLTVLHCATWSGNQIIVKLLLKQGADVNQTNNAGLSPLHCASWNENSNVIKILIEAGANIDWTDEDGLTALHYASRAGNVDVVKLLLHSGAKINIATENKITPLHYAARNGDINTIRILLKKGAAINYIDKKGLTPIHYALQNGNDEAVAVLLEKNFNINFTTKDKFTLLHMATRNNNVDTVKLLLSKNPNVNATTKRGLTPIHNSARNGNVDITKLLLDNGANINLKSNEKLLPLHYAARSGKLDVVKILLEGQNTIMDRTKNGGTPLHYAAINGNSEVIKYLLDNGAEINAIDKNNYTPLHMALKNENEAAAILFLERNADVNVQSVEYVTPLHIASEICSLDMVLLLLNAGAKTRDIDKNGLSPLHYAAKNKNVDVIDALLDNGAKLNIPDKNECHPLIHALNYGNDEVAIRLIDRGADLFSNVTVFKLKPVHFACRNCNPSTIKTMIKKRVNMNDADFTGMVPLHYAILGGKIEVVNLLLNEKVSINVVDGFDLSPLDYVVSNSDDEIWSGIENKGKLFLNRDDPLPKEYKDDVALLLLKNGANIVSNNDCIQKIHSASIGNSAEVIAMMLERGTDVNIKDDQNLTALHYSLCHKNDDVSHLLLNNGADVKVVSTTGITPLHYAAAEFTGNLDLINKIIEKGAILDAKTKSGLTSLHCASWNGSFYLVKNLIEKGVNVNVIDRNGLTALHYACRENNVDIVEFLLTKIDRQSLSISKGLSPLHLASENGHIESVQILLNNGANIECVNNDGKTALHEAIYECEHEISEILLKRGANSNAKSNMLITPLHYAAYNGDNTMVNLLLDNGAELDATDDQQLQPIHYAALNYHLNVIETLLGRGANINAVDSNKATVLHYIFRSRMDKKFNELNEKVTKPTEEFEESSSTLQFTAREHTENIVIKLFTKKKDRKPPTKAKDSDENILDILKLLLIKKININSQNEQGDTILHLAIDKDDVEAVKLILEHGEELGLKFDIRNNANKTPLDLLKKTGNKEIFNLLKGNMKTDDEYKCLIM